MCSSSLISYPPNIVTDLLRGLLTWISSSMNDLMFSMFQHIKEYEQAWIIIPNRITISTLIKPSARCQSQPTFGEGLPFFNHDFITICLVLEPLLSQTNTAEKAPLSKIQVGFLAVLFSSKYLTRIQIFEFAKIIGSIGRAFLAPFGGFLEEGYPQIIQVRS